MYRDMIPERAKYTYGFGFGANETVQIFTFTGAPEDNHIRTTF